MTPTARRWALALVLLGLGSSLASTYVHYSLLSRPGYLSFCDVSATVSCTEAYLSRFGSFRGVPVALLGAIWFVLALLVLLPARSRTAATDGIPAYLFALSTLALAVVLYLGYASFFVLKTVCLLCVATYAAVIGLFLLTGAATSIPMTSLPARLVRDLRVVATRPLALAVAMLFLLGAASAVAFFPREGAAATGAQSPAVPADKRSEFERWYEAQPRIQVPVSNEGAAVVVVKFNDYQCPPCRQTYMTYQSIFAKYQSERPGAVKLVTKDYPLDPECNVNVPSGSHVAACEAAVAVRLARQRQQHERMESWLFNNQATLTPAAVKAAARDVAGVQSFEADYGAALEQVKADVALGSLLQVRVTPTFFINGVRVEGGLAPQFFDLAIAYELKRAAK